jgi:hypothetical protein
LRFFLRLRAAARPFDAPFLTCLGIRVSLIVIGRHGFLHALAVADMRCAFLGTRRYRVAGTGGGPLEGQEGGKNGDTDHVNLFGISGLAIPQLYRVPSLGIR